MKERIAERKLPEGGRKSLRSRMKLLGAFIVLCFVCVVIAPSVVKADSDVEVTAGSSADAATDVSVGTSYVTEISTLNEYYWFKFTTGSEDAYYYLESKNISVPTHTWNYECMSIEICTKYGESLTSNSHIYNTTAKESNVKLDPNTTYYIRIINTWDGSTPGYFRFLITSREDPDGNEMSDATAVKVGTLYTASLAGSGDEDWFSFTTGSTSLYVFYAKNIDVCTHTWSSDRYFRVTVFDKYGNEISQIARVYGDEGTVLITLDPNTTYYVQAKNYWEVDPYNENDTYSFSVSVPEITSDDVVLSTTEYTYNGNARKPSATVTFLGTTLTKGTDYTISYSNNTNAGTATATITGKGNYTGTVKKTFTIKAKSISSFTVTLSKTSYTYNGKTKKPSVTLANGSTTISSSNYTVTYSSNKNAGTATVKVTGKGNYKGSVKTTFTISKATQKVTATAKSKSLVVGGTTKITASTTGTGKISYSSSNTKIAKVSSSGKITAVSPGKVTITVTAKATTNYKKATKTITIKVSPKATKITSLKNSSSKKITVKWSKVSGVTGYQIQYSTSSSFSSAKKVTVTGASSSSKVISSLKKGKTYYVRIRTYKKVSGTNYYSSWSSKKSVKISK